MLFCRDFGIFSKTCSGISDRKGLSCQFGLPRVSMHTIHQTWIKSSSLAWAVRLMWMFVISVLCFHLSAGLRFVCGEGGCWQSWRISKKTDLEDVTPVPGAKSPPRLNHWSVSDSIAASLATSQLCSTEFLKFDIWQETTLTFYCNIRQLLL